MVRNFEVLQDLLNKYKGSLMFWAVVLFLYGLYSHFLNKAYPYSVISLVFGLAIFTICIFGNVLILRFFQN